MRHRTHFLLLLTLLLAGCGCSGINPSFPLSMKEAHRDLQRMHAAPVRLERPMIVLAGWQDPGFAAAHLAKALRQATGDDRILSVAFPLTFTFDACREKTIRRIAARFGPDTEVDVVGVSMGGIVARYAALPGHEPRLHIARLFTVSTPHRGARIANVPFPDPRAMDMKAGSPFMRRMLEAPVDYPIVPYVRLGDFMVGVHNAAPPEVSPWWTGTPPLQTAHLLAHTDARIISDIARRLRGETPWTVSPASPLP